MMEVKPQHLILNGKKYTYEFIATGNWNTSELDRFEKDTLGFCQSWMRGDTWFERYTSGSTGQPKKIKIHRQQILASVRMTGETLRLSTGDVALTCLDTQYIAGTMMLARSLVLGMQCIVVQPTSNPLKGLDPEQRIDFTALVPLQLQHILEEDHAQQINLLHQAKAIIIGGAPVSASLEKKLQVIRCPLYSTYGMTETVSHIALRRLNGPQKSEQYQAFNEVALGVDGRGCLTVQSALTCGKKIITNDRVKMTGKHQFQWLGRIDNVINTGGVKIQIEEVEKKVDTVLETLRMNCRHIVTGRKDERLGEKVILLLEHPPLQEPQEKKLREHLALSIDRYGMPREIITIQDFVETATGKIDRKKTLSLSRKDK